MEVIVFIELIIYRMRLVTELFQKILICGKLLTVLSHKERDNKITKMTAIAHVVERIVNTFNS